MRKVILCSLLCTWGHFPAAFTQQTAVPVNYTTRGQAYLQDFDGLPGTGTFSFTGKGPFSLSNTPVMGSNLLGWQFMMTSGSNANASFLLSTGSSTTSGLQVLGTTGGTDKALGSLSSGSGVYSIGMLLTNQTGVSLNSITLSFTAEQWRKGGSTNKNTWTFRYKTGIFSNIDQQDLLEEPHLNFSSVINTSGGGSINGNLPENEQVVSYTIIGINWKNGEQLLLRWDDADETGSDDACGMDNFSFSADRVISSPVVFNNTPTDITAHSVQLKSVIHDNNATTVVLIQYDTSILFLSPKTIHPQHDSIVSGTGPTAFSILLNELDPVSTYYYRFKATNANGSTTGSVGYFTTAVEPKIPPVIMRVSIADKPMKASDTVTVTISVKQNRDILRLSNATINALPLSTLVKKNDSTYTSFFVIANGGNDVAADSSIAVNITMIDSSGNSSGAFQQPIIQSNDPIDANRPFITQLLLPSSKTYRSGDTLLFRILFSEKILANINSGVPSIKLTVGNASKQALYINTIDNSMVFTYIIQTGDEDSIGIRIASVVTPNNAIIKDSASNNAILTLPLPTIANSIIVKGVAPKVNSVSVPPDRYYKRNDTLLFIVNFSDKVVLNVASDTPILKLTIGSSSKNMRYYKGSGTENFFFRYIVQKNDLDKNGLTLGALSTSTTNTITDNIGNPAVLTIKNAGSLTGVKIDAVSPAFVVPDTSFMQICETDTSLLLKEVLQLSDEEKGDTITWKIIQGYNTRGLSKTTVITLSTGNSLSPGDITYFPRAPQNPTDTLLVTASDGTNEIKKLIIIRMQPGIKNNEIGLSQYVCNGSTPSTITGTLPTGGNESYEYAWEFSVISDTANFSKPPGIISQKNFTPAKLTTTTWFRRKVFSGTCVDISAPIKLTSIKTGLWLGTVSSDWQNGNNWCGGSVPNQQTDVFIPAPTKYDAVIVDTASCNNIIIQDNARIAIKGNLQVTGSFTAGPGTIDITKGKLLLTGSAQQRIPSKCFVNRLINDLIINNPLGVTITDTVYLKGSLQLYNGFLQTNDQLIITYTGNIGSCASGTVIMGNISLENFIPSGKKQFRLIGHPFSHAIGLSMLSDSIDISGTRGVENGFRSTNYPSAFRYDPVTISDSLPFDEGWIAFTNTNGIAENAWRKFSGIRLWIRGKSGQGIDVKDQDDGIYLPQPVILKLTGQVNTGDQEIVLQKGKYTGYNVIANPYPSPIDLSLLSIGSGISKNFWVWNPQQGRFGAYAAIPFQSKYILPAFGAFIVCANGYTNTSVLFTENCKVTTTGVPDSLPVITGIDDHHIELRLESDSILWDRIFLYHSDSAKTGIDKYDAEKFINSSVNFYSITKEQKRLSVDVRSLTTESIIPLGIQTDKPGAFSIKFVSFAVATSGTLLLHDRYLSKWIVPEKDSSYYFVITTDTASYGDHRFEIRTKEEIADTLSHTKKIVASIGPVPARNEILVNYACTENGNTSVRIINFFGKVEKTILLGTQKSGQVFIPIAELQRGMYLVEIRCGQQMAILKMIKQ